MSCHHITHRSPRDFHPVTASHTSLCLVRALLLSIYVLYGFTDQSKRTSWAMVLSSPQETLYAGKHQPACVGQLPKSHHHHLPRAGGQLPRAEDVWPRPVPRDGAGAAPCTHSSASGGDTAVPPRCDFLLLLLLPPGCASCLTRLASLRLVSAPDNVILS